MNVGATVALWRSTNVEFVRWPEDADRLDQLRASSTPRLVLVAPDAAPPSCDECCEDWVRLPATDDDIVARAEAVSARAHRHSPSPEVAGDGRIAFGGRWVAVSRTEEAFLRVLVAEFESVVPASSLIRATGDDSMTANAVRVHVMRLRKRIAQLGLGVRTVRGRGYVLEPAA